MLGIDRHDDTLGPESLRRFLHKFWPLNRRRIDAHLIGSRVQESPDVLKRPHAPSNGQRHKHPCRCLLDHIQNGLAIFMGGCDVQETELIGSFAVIGRGHFDRVSRITQIHKAHALHDAAVFDIETGNNTFGQHGSL
ncbi:MAG: hypothetical protein JW394_0882 [Nitrospira sp.]|nr:hypothetical protein [Nitrospira sp.]